MLTCTLSQRVGKYTLLLLSYSKEYRYRDKLRIGASNANYHTESSFFLTQSVLFIITDFQKCKLDHANSWPKSCKLFFRQHTEFFTWLVRPFILPNLLCQLQCSSIALSSQSFHFFLGSQSSICHSIACMWSTEIGAGCRVKSCCSYEQEFFHWWQVLAYERNKFLFTLKLLAVILLTHEKSLSSRIKATWREKEWRIIQQALKTSLFFGPGYSHACILFCFN